MRRILYPYGLDTFGLISDRVTRNALIPRELPLSLEDLAYAIKELEARIGTVNSADPFSIDARLRAIESVLGILVVPPVEQSPTTALFSDQWQAGYVSGAAASVTVVFGKRLMSDSYELFVRSYDGAGIESEVGSVVTREGAVFTLTKSGLTLEWAIRGTTETPSGGTLQAGVAAGVTAGGSTITMGAGYSATSAFVAFAAGVSGSIEKEVLIVKSTTQLTLTPSSTCDITWRTIGVTQ